MTRTICNKVTDREEASVGVQHGCGTVMEKVDHGTQEVNDWFALCIGGSVCSGSPANDKGIDNLPSCREWDAIYNNLFISFLEIISYWCAPSCRSIFHL